MVVAVGHCSCMKPCIVSVGRRVICYAGIRNDPERRVPGPLGPGTVVFLELFQVGRECLVEVVPDVWS